MVFLTLIFADLTVMTFLTAKFSNNENLSYYVELTSAQNEEHPEGARFHPKNY